MKFSNRLMARVVGHGLLNLNYRLSTGYCHIRVRCANDQGNPARVFAGEHLYGSVAGEGCCSRLSIVPYGGEAVLKR